MTNEDGLRALGAQVSGSGAGGRKSGSVANEKGLRDLGATIDGKRRSTRGERRRGVRRSGKPRWTGKQRLLAGVIALVVLVTGVAGAGWAYLQYRYDQLPKAHITAETAAVAGQPFNMLVLGSDSRVGESGSAFGSSSTVTGQRSDVLMIWHVDPQTKQIHVISIPRDTIVAMVGSDVSQFGQFNRINSAYNSGVNQLVATIQANFGIPINHVVQVDFGGFMGAVNALGGVYLNFNYPAKDQWSGLNITSPGCQLLNGAAALSVARSRHYYYEENGYWQYDGTSDFGRIHRQDAFLKALITSAEGKINPLTVNAFIGSLPQGVVIDDKFSLSELVSLAVEFHSFDPAALQTQTLPTTSIGYVSPWGDVLFVDQPAAQQMLVSVFGNQLTPPTSPPPDTSLNPSPPPDVTTTTLPPAATATTAPPASANTVSPTTTTTAPPPSFDPTAC